MFPWFIWEDTITGQLSLAKDHPGFGWLEFSGPYFSFADGGADMFCFGVPGWDDFANPC